MFVSSLCIIIVYIRVYMSCLGLVEWWGSYLWLMRLFKGSHSSTDRRGGFVQYYPEYIVWIIIIHYWIPFYDCHLGRDKGVLRCSHMLVAHVFMRVGLSKHGVGLGSFGLCACMCVFILCCGHQSCTMSLFLFNDLS